MSAVHTMHLQYIAICANPVTYNLHATFYTCTVLSGPKLGVSAGQWPWLTSRFTSLPSSLHVPGQTSGLFLSPSRYSLMEAWPEAPSSLASSFSWDTSTIAAVTSNPWSSDTAPLNASDTLWSARVTAESAHRVKNKNTSPALLVQVSADLSESLCGSYRSEPEVACVPSALCRNFLCSAVELSPVMFCLPLGPVCRRRWRTTKESAATASSWRFLWHAGRWEAAWCGRSVDGNGWYERSCVCQWWAGGWEVLRYLLPRPRHSVAD